MKRNIVATLMMWKATKTSMEIGSKEGIESRIMERANTTTAHHDGMRRRTQKHIPNKAGSETVAPTHNVHTKCGELLSHTAPTEGKLVSVPISYVVEEDPNSRYVSETQKQQTLNPKPKPKAQETKKQATWRKID